MKLAIFIGWHAFFGPFEMDFSFGQLFSLLFHSSLTFSELDFDWHSLIQVVNENVALKSSTLI